MELTNLRCEYVQHPLGIDVQEPRLSWELVSARRGCRQTAYRILAATSRERLTPGAADLWDSGRIASGTAAQIPYGGKKTRSGQICFFIVRVWDEHDHPSDWSKPASWEMGLITAADWRATWITAHPFDAAEQKRSQPASYFRREFLVDRPVKRARAYICGLGFHELYLNGERIGDHQLSPQQTDYDDRALSSLLYPFENKTTHRALYVTYIVTRGLKQGRNAAGVILGNGWYNQRERQTEGCMWYGVPRFILQIEILYEDGSRETVFSNPIWKATTVGPILHNGIYSGELYDARLEMPGWHCVGFDDTAWSHAYTARPPSGTLQAQLAPPDRIIQNVKPRSIQEIRPGVFRYDLGRDLAGWARIRRRGSHGEQLTLRFEAGEGHDYGQQDTYIFRGSTVEHFEPRFTWHAFRYVEAAGGEDWRLDQIEGRVVHSDVPRAGTFTCSNDRFNQLYDTFLWTQRMNMHGGVPSDCPHRERLGYTGDGQVCAEAAIYGFDMAAFYTKWIRDIADAQHRDSGFVPHTAPFQGGGGGPGWGSAIVFLPWMLYLYYGDKDILIRHYDAMKRWISYLATRTDKDDILVREEPGSWNLGDWAVPRDNRHEPPPPELVNTCFLSQCAKIMSHIAALLGQASESLNYADLTRKTNQAAFRRFFDHTAGCYAHGRAGADVFPLAFDMVPAQHMDQVFQHLVEHIVYDTRYHFDTGIFATPLLLKVLTRFGKVDLAYNLMNQEDFPSFGHMLAHGATTLWEHWDGSGSHNHPMFGSVCTWFFQVLAGIQPDMAQPGFKKIVLKPYPIKALTMVNAEYQSICGRIGSHWERSDASWNYKVEIPPNSRAWVYLPARNPSAVTESGRQLADAVGIHWFRREQNRLVCEIGAGVYHFDVK